MTWLVCKFEDTEEIEALPSNWYDEKSQTCLYPPFPRLQLERAIKNKQEPDTNWVKYKVKLMSSKRYESLLIASAKASKACVTSDISDVDVLPAKRVSKKKIISSSEESENSNSEESLSNVPQVHPNMRKGFEGSIIQQKPFQKTVIKESGPIRGFKNLGCSKDVGIQTISDINTPADDSEFKKQVIAYLVKHKKILNDQETKLSKLSAVVDENKVLLEKLLENIGVVRTDDNPMPNKTDVFGQIPIKTLEELHDIEEKLKDDKVFETLINDLRRLGGTSYKECIRRFLTKMMDDKIVKLYSLCGHKGKKSFVTTKLFAAMTDAVQLCDKNVTKKEIELKTGQWLAKASERLKSIRGNEDKENEEEDVN